MLVNSTKKWGAEVFNILLTSESTKLDHDLGGLWRYRQHVHVCDHCYMSSPEGSLYWSRYLQGKTKEEAFQIGNDIANTITALNPAPVKLKFEKVRIPWIHIYITHKSRQVYLPCLLLAKKRYVGFKYENVDDKDPVFDAKGIETVRRDGISAQQKMVETCLK